MLLEMIPPEKQGYRHVGTKQKPDDDNANSSGPIASMIYGKADLREAMQRLARPPGLVTSLNLRE